MTTQNPAPAGIDTTKPNVARIYDYLLGGKDNFAVHREAAIQLIAASPDMTRLVRDSRKP
jgi:S-adenosyl methyltransferase